MTYCVAISVDEGLVFASDSRTNAGVDNVNTYGKMHTFGLEGERQIVLLSAGNLATTQAVLSRLRRDIKQEAEVNLMSVPELDQAAEYLGSVVRAQEEKYEEAVSRSGFSAEATFVLGGQIHGQPHGAFLVYPQGNYITTSEQTPYLQIGETKYGRPILDRIIDMQTSLDEAARCLLVSLDSTMRSNVTVGPPIELLKYRRDSLALEQYLFLEENDPYLVAVRRAWGEKLTRAFRELPPVKWDALPSKQRFG